MDREAQLLRSLQGSSNLLEYLEIVKNKIADVRVPFGFNEDVRRAAIKVIDDFIIIPIETGSQKITSESSSYK